jgi:hypothetical protein
MAFSKSYTEKVKNDGCPPKCGENHHQSDKTLKRIITKPPQNSSLCPKTRSGLGRISSPSPNTFRMRFTSPSQRSTQLYADKEHGSPTASEREKQFPHLNAPTVELRNRLKQASASESELDSSTSKQPELFSGSDKTDRLKQQLAWIKKNQSLLGAISRSRDRVAVAVNGAYIRNREKVDVEFRLLQRIRVRISGALKGRAKSLSTTKLMGCSLPEFKAHLEKQFKAGMSWSNYGEWHVDHIRPCASFDLNDPVSLSQCFHYTNLQPMWALDNAKKNSSWEGKLIRRKNQE